MSKPSSERKLGGWKKDALRQMKASRRTTLTLLEKIPPLNIRRPNTQGAWSIKDVLAHIIAWEKEAVDRLQLIANGRADQVLFYEGRQTVDQFNHDAVKARRPLRLSALLREAEAVRSQLEEALQRLPTEFLNDSTHQNPVVGWLPEFAWDHEKAHRERIRKWLKTQSVQGPSRRHHRA